MRKILVASAVLALGLMSQVPARADIIADLNGSATGGVTPVNSAWQNYDYSFVATSSVTTIGFLIRNDPSYMGLDDISVTRIDGTTDLIANGGLEAGPNANSGVAPAGWYTVGTQGLNAAGQWRLGSAGSSYISPHSGNGWWYDGAVGGHDGIAQDISTVVGQTYDLNFWLGSNPVPNGSSVDYQVLAGALPGDVTVTSGTPQAPAIVDAPEPMSLALLASGFIALGTLRRKRG